MTKIDALINLFGELNPYKIIIQDDSEKHSNHYEQEDSSEFPSHVKITLVSIHFEGLSLIARQRLVNKVLSPAFKNGLHAASIVALTIDEFRLNPC